MRKRWIKSMDSELKSFLLVKEQSHQILDTFSLKLHDLHSSIHTTAEKAKSGSWMEGNGTL
jgi:hypothetical protein